MKKSLPSSIDIKAAGGIKTFEQVASLIDAGVYRIGTSSDIAITLSI